MRAIYVDEAGISANDPVVVVAGVVINNDKQWRLLEQKILSLINEHVPPDRRDGFVFHGKELFHGGKNFPREIDGVQTREQRWAILDKVVSIPREAGLPVCLGYWPSIRSLRNPEGTSIVGHLCAYSMCIVAAQHYLEALTDPDEIANVVAENRDKAKKHIKGIHRLMRDPDGEPDMPDVIANSCPITKIVDTVHFAEKNEAILLQLADVCAFVAARYMAKKWESKRFFEMMTGSCLLAEHDLIEAGAGHSALLWGYESEIRSAFANHRDKRVKVRRIGRDD